MGGSLQISILSWGKILLRGWDSQIGGKPPNLKMEGFPPIYAKMKADGKGRGGKLKIVCKPYINIIVRFESLRPSDHPV